MNNVHRLIEEYEEMDNFEPIEIKTKFKDIKKQKNQDGKKPTYKDKHVDTEKLKLPAVNSKQNGKKQQESAKDLNSEFRK